MTVWCLYFHSFPYLAPEDLLEDVLDAVLRAKMDGIDDFDDDFDDDSMGEDFIDGDSLKRSREDESDGSMDEEFDSLKDGESLFGEPLVKKRKKDGEK